MIDYLRSNNMDDKFENDIFERDISIEEFDHITDGVEDHVFSKEYINYSKDQQPENKSSRSSMCIRSRITFRGQCRNGRSSL